MKFRHKTSFILLLLLFCIKYINIFAAEDITLRQTKNITIPSEFLNTANSKYTFTKTIVLDNGTLIRGAELYHMRVDAPTNIATIDFFVIGYNSNGGILFSVKLNDYGEISKIKTIRSIRDLHDGTFTVCSADKIYRINYTGSVLWVKNYSHSDRGDFEFIDSINGRDGCLYVLGTDIPYRSKDYYTILSKYDFNGNLIGTYQVNYGEYESAFCLSLSIDNKFLNVFHEYNNTDNSRDVIATHKIDLSAFRRYVWHTSNEAFSSLRSVVVDDYNVYFIAGGGSSSASQSDYLITYFNGSSQGTRPIYLRDGFDYSGFTLYGVLVDNERVVTIKGGLNLISKLQLSYTYYDQYLNFIKRIDLPLTLPLDYQYTNYMDSKGILYGEIINSTQNKIYVYGPPLPTVSISANTSNIGDNTPILFEVNAAGPYTYLYVHDVTNNTGIWTGGGHTPVSLNLDFEGDKSILVQILDENWSVMNTSNVLTFNKRNVLSNVLAEGSNKSGMEKVFIISDTDRYYENNWINQSLVQELKKKVSGIYLISNTVSDVLTPLLKP